MRVLVTGGAGRLGRSVVAGLVLRGHHVTSVDTAVSPFDPPVEGVVADLLDPFQREDVFSRTRPEAVIHLAGIAVPFARPDADTFASTHCWPGRYSRRPSHTGHARPWPPPARPSTGTTPPPGHRATC